MSPSMFDLSIKDSDVWTWSAKSKDIGWPKNVTGLELIVGINSQTWLVLK